MRDIGVVYRKEIRESLRDRRILIGAFIIPLFLIFLLTRLTSTLEDSLGSSSKVEMTVVGKDDHPLVAQLRKSERVKISYRNTLPPALEELRQGKTNLVLALQEFVPGEKIRAKAYFESARPMSQAAFGGIREAVAVANSQALKTALTSRGVDIDEAEPMALESEDVAKEKGVTGGAWLMLLPYLVILWSFYGGSSLASDLVAGEKEKKTLETLLLTPVSRFSITAGKHLALSTICLLSGLVSVLGLALAGLGAPGGGIQLGPEGIAAFLAVLGPLVLLYAGALLAVSSLARSMREAQTYLAVLSFVVMTPAVMSQFIGLTGADRTEWVRWIPILNTSVVMNQAMRGRVDWSLAFQSAAIALVLAGAAAWLCVRLFEKETILRRV